MSDERRVQAPAYLQVRPEWATYADRTDVRQVRGARVVKVTQKRSENPEPGTVEVKVVLDLPASIFVPLMPEAVVVVPDSLTVAHPIQAEATDPREGDA